MSDVPPELRHEILLRVPAEPLFRFRSVCKAWRRVIDDITFAKMHLRHQMDVDQSHQHLVIRTYTGKLYSLPLSSLEWDCFGGNHTRSIEIANIKYLVRLGVPRIRTLPVPSYGGLILITHRDERKIWTLWNPFTQESFELPPHDHLTRGACIPCSGIGYDSTTDDFKVVRILQIWGPDHSCRLDTLIYSLKSNNWKRIANFPDCRKPAFGANGVFVNGALHWITDIIRHGKAAECVIAFDLSTEEDRVLPWPSFLSPEQFLSDMTLDVLGGYLCLWNSRVIWLMKDYGENVWIRLVSLTQLPNNIRTMGKPIAYIKSKGQVLFHHDTEFFLFDVEMKRAKKFSIGGFSRYFTSQVFPFGLFRLNRSGSGGGGGGGSNAFKGTLKRKRETAGNRLKVELQISDVDGPPSGPSDKDFLGA
ncbi:hypothetical protein OROMI_007536 [Orobanche minor]